MLEIANLSVSYGRVRALDGVEIAIKEPLNSAIFAAASVGRTAFGGLAPEIHGDFRLSEASSSLFRDAGQTPPPNLKRPV